MADYYFQIQVHIWAKPLEAKQSYLVNKIPSTPLGYGFNWSKVAYYSFIKVQEVYTINVQI